MKYVYVNTGEKIELVIFSNNPENDTIKNAINNNFINNIGYAIYGAEVLYNRYTEILEVANNTVTKVALTGDALLQGAKAAKIAEIAAYDTSDAVNGFSIGGKTMWLGKLERLALIERIELEKKIGSRNTTLWNNGVAYHLPIDSAAQMLMALSKYANDCYDATQRHMAAVNALTAPEAVTGYDFKAGYPQQLNFSL